MSEVEQYWQAVASKWGDDRNQLEIGFGSKEQMIAVAQAMLEIASKV